MPRYIDAEIAIEKCNILIDNADSCPNPYAIEGVRVVRNIILSDCETGVPTADVVEVKHGTWFCETDNKGVGYAKCSACGGTMSIFCYGHDYCPHCGAKMD